jgi:putative phage-type endonuclease
MQIHNVTQGTAEWHALRATHLCASEAPIMMGVSPYMTRDALIKQKATGLTPDHSNFVLTIFEKGHEAEAAYRPIAEHEVGQELYPVTGTLEVDGLPLLASFDGLTMTEDLSFEHKLYNSKTAMHIDAHGEPPDYHYWQLEHQLLVSSAENSFFVTSDGTNGNGAKCYYQPKQDRRHALIAGWKQFVADVAAYKPRPEAAPVLPPKAIESLPALRVEVSGMVTASNLREYKVKADAFFAAIKRDLQTDQDFADAEATVKVCADIEARIKAAKDHALSQTASIDELFKAVDAIAQDARQTRLDLDKLVKARKESIKLEKVQAKKDEFATHLQQLNNRLHRQILTTNSVNVDFGLAIKGLRTIDSIDNALNTALANAKIALNAIADTAQANIAAIESTGNLNLFADICQLATQPAEHVALVIQSRLDKQREQQEAEAKRIRAQIEQEQREQQEAEKSFAETTQPVEHAATTATESQQLQLDDATESAPATQDLIKLGEINARIAPLSINADGMKLLGFDFVATDKSAKLYRESDFGAMCTAIIKHITNVRNNE